MPQTPPNPSNKSEAKKKRQKKRRTYSKPAHDTREGTMADEGYW
jgi:hypothetical protein